MNPKLPVLAAIALAACLFSTAAKAAPDDPAESLDAPQRVLHANAVQMFRQNRFAGAFGRFAALADAGHAPSARIALLMADRGPDLFGYEWSHTAEQRRRWLVLAAAAERDPLLAAADEGRE